MQEGVLLVEKKNGVATLTLNRPDQMNALSLELRWELQAALEDIGADPEIGVVVLTGAGKAFCAGLDLKRWVRRLKKGAQFSPRIRLRYCAR